MLCLWRELDRDQRRLLAALISTSVTLGIGFGAIFPILPLLATSRGNGVNTVAAMATAYIVASFALQYPMAWVSDRFGPRRVIALSLFAYALLGFAWLIHGPAWELVLLRFLQGFANGAAGPAMRGLLARMISAERRGQAFGVLAAGDWTGLVLGPVLGGFVGGVASYEAVFILQGTVGIAGAIVFSAVAGKARLRDDSAPAAGPSAPTPGTWRDLITGDLLGVTLLATATRYLIAMYDTLWVLFMHRVGASAVQIGLSLTLFAMPLVVLAAPAGRIGDRFDRRIPLLIGQLASAFFAITYPFLPSIPLILGVGVVEGCFTALVRPNLFAVVAAASPRDMQARGQAFVNVFGVVGDLLAPALTALLLPRDVHLPFMAGAAFMFAFSVAGGALLFRPGSLIPARAAPPADATVLPGDARAPAFEEG